MDQREAASSVSATHSPRLYVCRHGERIDFVDYTWWERSARPFDPHLSPHGYQQASHLADRLKSEPHTTQIRHILCSPYVRCIETIYPFATEHNLSIKIEHGLAEWFGAGTVVQEIHHPLTTAELHEKFPLVDPEYVTKFSIESRALSELDVHQRLYDVAQYVTGSFYKPEVYSGDVMLVTHAAGVIAAVRGILALKSQPKSLPTWYAPGGPGRVHVYAGVSCFHELTQSDPIGFQDWEYSKSESSANLLDPQRDYDWAYRPDRSKM